MPTLQDRKHITAADLSADALEAAGFTPSKLNRDAKRKLASVVDLMASLSTDTGTKKKRAETEELTPDKRARINGQINAGCRELVQLPCIDTDFAGVKRACEKLATSIGSTS